MRYLALALLAVVGFAGPLWAGTNAPLPYSLTLTGTASKGTITGTLGGVQVQGTYQNGTWTVAVQGQTFATGSYTCTTGCTFTGTTLIGKSVSFSTSTALLGTTSARVTLTGSFASSQFPTHGAWVSAVAQWANAHLEGAQVGKVVSEAAKIEGPEASSTHAASQGKAQPSSDAGGHPAGEGGQAAANGHGK